MINVKIKTEYKSIKPCEFVLPDFSVLTGLNGSGKTHLLEALDSDIHCEVFINGKKISNVRYIPFNGLNSAIEENCDPATITTFIKDFWTRFATSRDRVIKARAALVESNLYGYSSDGNFNQIGHKIIP